MRATRFAALAILTALATAPANAAPFIFSGYVEGRLGYVTDPFLDGRGSGAGLAGVTIAPALTQTGARSQTTLSGNYYREQYFSRYGYSENYGVDATRSQQLNERLTAQGHIGYANTNNATLGGNYDPLLNDLFTVGQRSWRLTGDTTLAWQATARDQFVGSFNATHVEYNGNRLAVSDYDQYSGSLDYLHTLNGRTKLGGTVSYVRYLSKNYPDSEAVQPGIKIEQILSSVWTFTGDVGVIMQKLQGDSHTRTSMGFHASLCGQYPLSSVCVRGSRSSTATGIGGLSSTTSISATYTRRLSEHQNLSLTADYQTTKYDLTRIGGLNARFLTVNADYSRDITRRLSAGVSGRYQTRRTGDYGNEHSAAGTVNLRMKIGRIS